jgi:hypothetical protein
MSRSYLHLTSYNQGVGMHLSPLHKWSREASRKPSVSFFKSAARDHRGQRHSRIKAIPAKRKEVWIETTNQQTFTSALEAGATTFLFQQDNGKLVEAWQKMASFEAILNCEGDLERGQQKV